MKRLIAPFAFATLAGASFAFAQSTTSTIPPLPEPTYPEPGPLAEQPRASIATGAQGPDVDVARTVVQALAADPQLKGSKFTVSPEEGALLITGVTPTAVQRNHAVQLATQHAGEGNVRNAIMVEQVVIAPIATGTDALAANDSPTGNEGQAASATQAEGAKAGSQPAA